MCTYNECQKASEFFMRGTAYYASLTSKACLRVPAPSYDKGNLNQE
jgi:hypothetical protein